MAETGNTTRTQLINLEGLSTFLDESKKIFEPTLPAGTDGQVLKLSGGKPTWGTDNTPTAFKWTNGTTAGPTGSLTGNGMSAVSFGAIPSASPSASGVVTTGAQTFAGKKTFNSTIGGSVDGNAATATTADKTAHGLSIKDGASTPAAAINSWNGSADKTLTIEGESPVATAAEDGTIKITHGTSGVTAGTYRSLTVDAKGHVTAGTNPTTLSGYGITDAKIAGGVITLGSNTITPLTASSTLAAGKVSGTLATSNIPNLDASKITSGTISIERLPSTALERCVVVANDAARFKLTTASVQVGDTVKVTDTKKMYMVVDSSKLSTEAGYEEYFTSTDWSTITNKPSSYTPSSHTHTKSQITDFPTKMPASDVYDWAKAENKPSYAWNEITNKPTTFTPATHSHDAATQSASGFMSSTDKAKLDGIASGAEVNQNAFGKVTVGSTTIEADSKTDTLTLVAGNNVTITPNAANDAITFASSYVDTTYSAGTDLELNETTFNHKNSGVTKGTYRSVTVNERGHVTAGTNPTTLGGYGITDAKIANGVITLGSNTITPLTADSVLNASKITSGTINVSRLPVFEAGNNVTITPDTANNKITFASSYVDTTYTFGEGTTNGAFTVAPSGGAPQSVAIHGLGSAAYSESSAYLSSAGGAVSGVTNFTNTTDSTDKTSGAVKISGGLGVAKNIYAAAVHNAIWNDLADCMEVPENTSLEYGYCYSWDGDNVIKSSRSSKNCIGVHSNTAGFVMGGKKTKTIQAAVAGFVLAYVDKLYPEGTPLTWGDDGVLTKCGSLKRIFHPERVIATFYREEKKEKWYDLPVLGRHWVKVN